MADIIKDNGEIAAEVYAMLEAAKVKLRRLHPHNGSEADRIDVAITFLVQAEVRCEYFMRGGEYDAALEASG